MHHYRLYIPAYIYNYEKNCKEKEKGRENHDNEELNEIKKKKEETMNGEESVVERQQGCTVEQFHSRIK